MKTIVDGADCIEHIVEAPADQSIAVRAGPGTGKTYLIAQRVASLIKRGLRKNSRIACITYTNTGVEEVENELIPEHFVSMPKGIFLGTIHSFLIDYVLKPYGHFSKDIPRDFRLTPPDGYAERFCPVWMKKDLPSYKLRIFESVGYDLKGEPVCYRKTSQWTPSKKQMTAFKNSMHRNGYLDLYDVLYFSWKILTENSFILDCLSCRFASILVDEFQDTTILQNAILELFRDTEVTSLFLVGDPDQSIFSFAGAVPKTFQERLDNPNFFCDVISGNRRSSNNILKFLKDISSLPSGQVSLAQWADYPEQVRILIPASSGSDQIQPSEFYRDALSHFFDLSKENYIDIDNEEAFCVLAYENKDVVELKTVHSKGSLNPSSRLDDLKKTNLFLYRVVYALLLSVRHKQEGEWGMAYEAIDRALTRLVFREGNPTFCSYEDEEIGLNRRLWSVVVWKVLDEIEVKDSQSLFDWCKSIKDLVDLAVQQAGGKKIRQKRLGKLDCRGKTRKISKKCKVKAELIAVIRPNIVGDNFRTIHKAKGIQREAVFVLARDEDELESWIFPDNITKSESTRIGYVAFSRAKKILCICCADVSSQLEGRLTADGVKVLHIGDYQLRLIGGTCE